MTVPVLILIEAKKTFRWLSSRITRSGLELWMRLALGKTPLTFAPFIPEIQNVSHAGNCVNIMAVGRK